MNRRAFLALLASAPLAALAPWQTILDDDLRQYRSVIRGTVPIGHPSCHCRFCTTHRQYISGRLSEMGGFDWYADPDVAYGRGYIREPLDASGNATDVLRIKPIPPSEVRLDPRDS